jgi:hypothetical protein
MKTIFLIEVETDGTWVAMYAPCYSRTEAERKEKVKARLFGQERVRISLWQWIGSGPLHEAAPQKGESNEQR